jgi:predicted ATPase
LHRALIGVLAGLGRRWEAIEAYERLRDTLDDIYAAEPEPQTKALYRQLLTGGEPMPRAKAPGAQKRAGPPTQPFVGRQPEWERLRSSWQRASVGESHLFLIGGEAGIGKTRLAEQFLTWADQQGIATARTRSFGADGRLTLAPVTEWLRSDAIRESLGQLDDVWLTETARLMPELLTEGPNLRRPEPMVDFLQRQRFFEALSRAVLASRQPLLLLIDDLQWCDQETLQWLHFLLRFDPRKRLLVIGTARLEELVPAHPVARWLLGLRSEGSVTELALGSLGAAETAQLAVQIVKRELDDQSALRLYQETEGNPLFVVEMASAGLGKAARERWSGGGDFSTPQQATAGLPPRMHAVIAARLAQLSPGALELAGLAAAVGRVFTVEILREASGADADSLTDGLDELWHRRIVRVAPQQSAVSPVTSTGESFSAVASSFDFSHDKIRDVAYSELGPIKQRYWHLRIAQAMEVVYAADLDPVSTQLAAHYEQAGEAVRAIPFYQHAAEVAQRVYAHEEAIGLIGHGLGLLDSLTDKRRDEQRLSLLRLLSLALVATHGYGAPEVLDTLSRAQVLNEQLGKPPDPLLLRALAIARLNSGNFSKAQVLGEQLLQLADQQRDPILLVEGHYALGVTLFWTGSFTRSRSHLQQALAHYDPTHSPAHITRYSQDPNVICQCRLAFDLLCLGYPEQAKAVQYKGLAEAQALAHPFSLAYALTWDAMLHGVMGDFDSLLQSAEAAIELSHEHHLGLWSSWATLLRGWALAEAGELELGILEIRRGDERMRATGALFLRPFASSLLAEQVAKKAQVEHGLALLNEALANLDNDRSWYDAEMQRLSGELLSAQCVESEKVEAAYRRAIQMAQIQQAKLFELRATTSLAQLWLKQGRALESRRALTQIYGWFTEGFDMPDLKEARALLDASLSETSAE